MDAIGHGGQGLRHVRYASDNIVTDRVNPWKMHEVPETHVHRVTHTYAPTNETSILTFSTDSQGM